MIIAPRNENTLVKLDVLSIFVHQCGRLIVGTRGCPIAQGRVDINIRGKPMREIDPRGLSFGTKVIAGLPVEMKNSKLICFFVFFLFLFLIYNDDFFLFFFCFVSSFCLGVSN